MVRRQLQKKGLMGSCSLRLRGSGIITLDYDSPAAIEVRYYAGTYFLCKAEDIDVNENVAAPLHNVGVYIIVEKYRLANLAWT